ncbi:ATP-binding protein, partial [Aquimarina litoralis]|uniref:ATP-binding protein n=1 Tax=Aquimarina litoralis TaxID=584605 RepID=UPI001C59C369
MIKVKDIFLFVFFIANINICAQSSEDSCDLWRKQLDTITDATSLLRINQYMIPKLPYVCKAEAYISSAYIYRAHKEIDTSLYLNDQAILFAEKSKNQEILAYAFEDKASTLIINKDFDEAGILLKKAQQLLKNFPDSDYKVSYYHTNAFLADSRLDYYTAIEYTDSIIENLEKTNNHIGIPISYIGRARYYFNLSQYEQAAKDMLYAIELKENQGSTFGLEEAYFELGNCYYEWGQYEIAKKYLKKSISLSKEKKDDRILLSGLLILSKCDEKLKNEKESSRSVTMLDSIIDQTQVLKLDVIKAKALHQKGNVYFNLLKEYNKAELLYKEAYVKAMKSKDTIVLHQCILSLVSFYNFQKEYKSVEKYLIQLRQITRKIPILAYKQDTYKFYSHYFEGINRPDSAVKYVRKYHAIRDDISNLELKTKVADLEKKYDTKKKELTIVALNQQKEEQEQIAQQAKYQQNLYLVIAVFLLFLLGIGAWAFRKLKKQQKELASTNQIKNHLFSIIAHDLRGMIIPFQRSGKILKYHIEKGHHDKTIELSHALEQNSESLSDMLDNLLDWSLEQMDGYAINLQRIIVGQELQEIVSAYEQQAAYKKTKIELKYANELSIDFDKGAFHVIFRNLIGNALKYTEEGNILIEFKRENNSFLCSVTDTGVGIDKEQLEQLFVLDEKKSTTGTHGEKGTGLGLHLVHRFIKMHKG